MTIDVGKSLAAVWGKLMMEKRFHSAAQTAFLARLIALETNDTELQTGAASWLLETLREINGQR
jgi:hypothetical protein